MRSESSVAIYEEMKLSSENYPAGYRVKIYREKITRSCIDSGNYPIQTSYVEVQIDTFT
jgi:hypothetical protein